MSAAHTPGPWAVNAAFPNKVNGPDGRHVATVGFGMSGKARANAALIAEAPAMLEALRDTTDELDAWLQAAIAQGEINARDRKTQEAKIERNRAILARIDGVAA